MRKRVAKRWLAAAFALGQSWIGLAVSRPAFAQEDTTPAAASAADAPAQSAPAAGFERADDIGFGAPVLEPSSPSSAQPLPSEAPSPFHVHAILRLQTALRTRTGTPQRIAMLRQVTDVGAEYKAALSATANLRMLAGVHTELDFAYLAHPSKYDPVTLDTRGWEIWARETYVALSLPVLELSVGYQIQGLGPGEMLSLLDLINGRDLREPMPIDFANVRLPVLLTRLSLNVARLRLETFIVHEASFGLLPPPLGELSPFRRLLRDNSAIGPTLPERGLRIRHEPGRDLRELGQSQFFARTTWTGTGYDLALIAGTTLERMGIPGLPSASELSSETPDFPLYHPRYTVLAHTGALTIDRVELRWELVYDHERPFAVRRTNTRLPDWGQLRGSMMSGMIGLTYFPGLNTSTALELSQTYLFDNPERIEGSRLEPLFPLEATLAALRLDHRFLSDRAGLALVFLLVGIAPVNAWTARVEATYSVLDYIDVAVGYVMYHPTNRFGLFYGFTEHDRVFANLRCALGN